MQQHIFQNPAKYFVEARKSGYAIGAFNFSNMETAQAIADAATKCQKYVMLQVTESTIKYMQMEYLLKIAEAVALTCQFAPILHLDHGSSFEICKTCIDCGFRSVMIDKSMESFAENIKTTKLVVEYAHKHGCFVEAELGTLSGVEDHINVSDNDACFTDANQAKEFVELTGVDSLAVAIGTKHGPNKGKTGIPKLQIDRLSKIQKTMPEDFPLVLHGASSVYQDVVAECNKYGATITNAYGISDEDIKNAIKNGVIKINVDTDTRLAFTAGIRKTIAENTSIIDPRKYLECGKNLATESIIRKINSFSNCS